MPETVICLLGEAAFTKGSRILELRWLLDGGRAQFLAISWQDGIQWISIPPLDLHHNLRDTPPVPGKSPSGKRG